MIDLRKFRDSTVDYIHHMSKYCHLTTDNDERISYRQIKRDWLLLLYKNNLIDRLVYQNTHSNDMLVWFHVGNRSFHLRKKHFNPGDLPLDPDLHEKDSDNTLDSIDFSFREHIQEIKEIIYGN